MKSENKPLFIFDIDGTCTLLGDRLNILKEKTGDRWDRFYAACGEDAPNVPVLDVMDSLIYNNLDVWLCTARRESEREATMKWFHTHMWEMWSLIQINPGILTMRPNGDTTKDNELKESWLNGMLLEDRERLVAVFDDRQKVVDMYRANGVMVFQVSEGKF